MLTRFLRFNVVSGLGVGVQLFALHAFVGGLGYMAATVLAVSISVVHNFTWHCVWTWADRVGSIDPVSQRLGRFAVANGAVSLVGNLALMAVLVGGAGLDPVAANAIAIAACGLLNFWLGEKVVFT
jgi:putative flippase GtrA